MKIQNLIDALHMAQGGELAANLENTQSTIGIGNAIQAILFACDRNQLPNQKQTVYDDMLMSKVYEQVADTAIVQHAHRIRDAYQSGSLSEVGRVVAAVIEDDLQAYVAEFEGIE